MEKYTKTLTVDKLIKALQKLSDAGHSKAAVSLDGGCCTGDAGSVAFEGGQVCIHQTRRVVVPATKAEIAEAARKAKEKADHDTKVREILKVRPLSVEEMQGDFSKSDSAKSSDAAKTWVL